MVNVQKYQIVAIGDSVSQCEENYLDLLASNGIGKGEDSSEKDVLTITGRITKIAQAVVEGNSHYYLMVEGSQEIFDVSVAEYLDIIRYEVGDEITMEYQTGGKANVVLSLEGTGE